jgi:hypothetical protein
MRTLAGAGASLGRESIPAPMRDDLIAAFRELHRRP